MYKEQNLVIIDYYMPQIIGFIYDMYNQDLQRQQQSITLLFDAWLQVLPTIITTILVIVIIGFVLTDIRS